MRLLLNGRCHLILLFVALLCMPVFAEDAKPQDAPAQPAPAPVQDNKPAEQVPAPAPEAAAPAAQDNKPAPVAAPDNPPATAPAPQTQPAASAQPEAAQPPAQTPVAEAKQEPAKQEPAQEEQKPQPTKQEPSKQDIWQEVFFESSQDFDIDDPRVQQMLEDIKKSDPQKAEKLEALKKEDFNKYVEAIRLEIREALKPQAKPEEKPKETTLWQEQIQKRHEFFMEWFSKEFPADYAELLKVRDANPEKYVQRVMDMMTIYEPIQKTQKYHPELAKVMKKDIELQKQRDALLLRIRTAVPNEQPQFLKELEALVAARFDIIVQKKELQYESLRHRLEKLEQQLDEQAMELENLKKNKAQTVEDHIKELMSRTEKVSL